MKEGWIIGSTGLVGNELSSLMLSSGFFSSVNTITRKPENDQNRGIINHVVNFDDEDSFPKQGNINALFICLGTTMKKAGSKEAFRKVDYEYVLRSAKWAKERGAEICIFISSVGADPHSSNFYLRTKGEIEEALKRLHYKNLIILRPSLLLGSRKEFRLTEKIASLLAGLFSPFMTGKLKRYKAVQAKQVARAMLGAAFENNGGVRVLENEEIIKFNS